ncbi:hypothetical protein NM688_g5903 [Phlebia brevispora]|uniref:Uncharacterized protein n=1 Tax=Phlebia brevispora TaxID=194682 RepID=A0ACC1SMV5_9APHY|nr:hypothetical protein NM688_g5903 [Phlebia brevispora]
MVVICFLHELPNWETSSPHSACRCRVQVWVLTSFSLPRARPNAGQAHLCVFRGNLWAFRSDVWLEALPLVRCSEQSDGLQISSKQMTLVMLKIQATLQLRALFIAALDGEDQSTEYGPYVRLWQVQRLAPSDNLKSLQEALLFCVTQYRIVELPAVSAAVIHLSIGLVVPPANLGPHALEVNGYADVYHTSVEHEAVGHQYDLWNFQPFQIPQERPSATQASEQSWFLPLYAPNEDAGGENVRHRNPPGSQSAHSDLTYAGSAFYALEEIWLIEVGDHDTPFDLRSAQAVGILSALMPVTKNPCYLPPCAPNLAHTEVASHWHADQDITIEARYHDTPLDLRSAQAFENLPELTPVTENPCYLPPGAPNLAHTEVASYWHADQDLVTAVGHPEFGLDIHPTQTFAGTSMHEEQYNLGPIIFAPTPRYPSTHCTNLLNESRSPTPLAAYASQSGVGMTSADASVNDVNSPQILANFEVTCYDETVVSRLDSHTYQDHSVAIPEAVSHSLAGESACTPTYVPPRSVEAPPILVDSSLVAASLTPSKVPEVLPVSDNTVVSLPISDQPEQVEEALSGSIEPAEAQLGLENSRVGPSVLGDVLQRGQQADSVAKQSVLSLASRIKLARRLGVDEPFPDLTDWEKRSKLFYILSLEEYACRLRQQLESANVAPPIIRRVPGRVGLKGDAMQMFVSFMEDRYKRDRSALQEQERLVRPWDID